MSARDNEAADEVLMLRYQRGDKDAFAVLVRRYQVRVYNFVLRHLRSEASAEEIAQEVFLRIVQRASAFKHEARFSTWLYTIARNLCVDHLRKANLRRHPSLDQPVGSDADAPSLGEQVADPAPTVERRAASSQVAFSILQAVDELSEDQREVFLLREIAHLPFKEIAELTNTSENTVKSRMRYALEHLQLKLSEFEEYARALR
ncbi:MAG TPA: RNA polymerase sigma factor [Polyangiaceae bacterium]|nr:RNA polymerase sigma factor [Polyangiaceae bacterium]